MSEKDNKATSLIPGFDPKAFAKNLASQAGQVIPPDIKGADRNFIVEIVYKFCFLSGDALSKDESITMDSSQASLVSQFIGEWAFHKAVDMVRGNIEVSLREGVLQKVAFTVFEVAKQAVLKRMPQEQIIPLVEHHVNTCFKEAINDLKEKGALDETSSQNVLNQSNIDEMAQTQAESEVVGANMSDAKILKLASLALLIKSFPIDKIKNIVGRFNKPEAEVLVQYIKMPDLESKIDTGITARCLEEIKGFLPQPQNLTIKRCYSRLYKIVKNSDKNKISNIIKDERPIVKDFVESAYNNEETVIPARVAAVVCKYLEEKV